MMKTSRQLKDKIRNLAASKSANAQLLMRTFMTERFLERVSRSEYKEKLILKGGTLVTAMVGVEARSTMDVDVTVQGIHLSEDTVASLITKIASIPVEDGVEFFVKSVSSIMDDVKYPGYRVSMDALFDGTITAMKLDLSTDDVITPGAIEFPYRLMFEKREIPVLSYNLETVLAEKIETILSRGVLNTRMRDYYDIYILNELYHDVVTLSDLGQALNATAGKRGTARQLIDAKAILQECVMSKALSDLWSSYASTYSYASSITWQHVTGVVIHLVDEVMTQK
ncbi:MAG: nucleotidyl transferase AbiEii/AbiGii toxin family protein [Clostridiales bacterium]|nr:nucleotidyl transferase AbiEii/AbiGii toxin family protein [Clostridiales bacterium]